MVTLPRRPFVQICTNASDFQMLYKCMFSCYKDFQFICTSRVGLRTTLEIKPDRTNTRKLGSVHFISIPIPIQLTQNRSIQIQIPLGQNLSIQIQK